RARPARGGRQRKSWLGPGEVRVEPLEPGRPGLSLEPRPGPTHPPRPGRLAALDRGLHAAVAHAARAVVERALELADLDPGDPDLPGGAAPAGRTRRGRAPRAQSGAQDPQAAPLPTRLSGGRDPAASPRRRNRARCVP